MTTNDVLFLTGVGTGLFIIFVGVTVWSWIRLEKLSNHVDELSSDVQAEFLELNRLLQTEVNELNRRIMNTYDELNSELKEQLGTLNLRITTLRSEVDSEIKEIYQQVEEYLDNVQDK
jgi:hypothetical protein